jgi:hypothetical protein
MSFTAYYKVNGKTRFKTAQRLPGACWLNNYQRGQTVTAKFRKKSQTHNFSVWCYAQRYVRTCVCECVCVCVCMCVWRGVGLLFIHRNAASVHDHDDQSARGGSDSRSAFVSRENREVSDRSSGSASLCQAPRHLDARLSHHRQFWATPNILRHTKDLTVHPVPPEWSEAPEFNLENWSTAQKQPRGQNPPLPPVLLTFQTSNCETQHSLPHC